MAPLATGGLVLGFLQAAGSVSYNEILFEFLFRWISLLVALVFGGDSSNFTDGLTV